MRSRDALPMVCLLVLAVCVMAVQSRNTQPAAAASPRCQITDRVAVSFPVSSEKECDRINKVRGDWQ